MKSFAEAYPELMDEWSPNNEYQPEDISYGSNKKIIWNGKCGHTWEATAKNRRNGSGCPFCSGNKALKGFNDLTTLFPALAEEWSELNHPLLPSLVTVKANRKVWWRCRNCGQHWQARIADRTDGHGCPVCAGEKLVQGINDLFTEHPDIAVEWSDRNEKAPTQVWSKSRENVWWKCSACGHEWSAVINSRVKGQKCPACTDRVVRKGYNDLKTVCPTLAAEWDYGSNGDLLPENILASSMRVAFWKCGCGHRWRSKISDRRAGTGCPNCEAREDIFTRLKAIAYYADKAGEKVLFGNDDVIGIELEVYLPESKAAIQFSNLSHYTGVRKRYENAKNWLCLNSGIKFFRILAPDSEEFDNCICITLTDDTIDILSAAIQTVFDMIRLPVDVDVWRDMGEISRIMVEW